MQHNTDEKTKQVYEKPRLRIIELAAEEVLGISCKTGFSDPKGVSGQGCLGGICVSTRGS
jgi:hypothetical protein